MKSVVEQPLTREAVVLDMLNYLERKYEAAFVCQSISYQSWSQVGYEEMLAYPKGADPYRTFLVRRYEEGQRYADGYTGYEMEKIYQEKVEAAVKSYFPDCVVRSGFASKYLYPDVFTPTMDFSQFDQYKNNKNRYMVGIYLAAEQSESLEEKFLVVEKDLKEIFQIGRLSFIGYSKSAFEKNIINDSNASVEKNRPFSSEGKQFVLRKKWGQIAADNRQWEGE